MECHNERAARSRRHHEKKKRAKAKLEEEQRREQAAQHQAQGAATPTPSSLNPSRSYTTPTLSADGSIDAPPQRSSSMDDAAAGPSLNVPTSRSNKRRSLNPGLRLAEQEPGLAASNPASPNPGGLYSPAFSVDSSTMPSPGLVTTGSMAAQASSHSVPSNDGANVVGNGADRGRQQLVLDSHQPGGEGHSMSPETPSSAGGTAARSRSCTPVPSNVDASGRASDDSETDGVQISPPKLALNGVDQTHPSPIKLSFDDDPAFAHLLTSFGGDAEPAPLTLRDPAGSRRSMQALANVALRLSEDSAIPNTPSTGSTIVQEPPAVPERNALEEKTTLPPLPKESFDGARVSSDDSHARSSSDSRQPSSLSSPVTWGSKAPVDHRPRLDSSASASSKAGRPPLARADTADLVSRRLKEALTDATDRGANAVKLDKEFVEAILVALQGSQNRYTELKGRLDGMKRVSQKMFDGLSVAQGEYDSEVASRRDAEAEVSRLRLQLATQSAELASLNAEQRKREMMEKMSKEMSDNLQGLEQDLSKLKAERDLTLAEVEELQSTREGSEAEPTKLSRSLTNRFDNLKSKYKRDLEPMIAERQTLQREINELKQAKDICLEETTALTARNDELNELNVAMTRRLEDLQGAIKPRSADRKVSKPTPLPPLSSTTSIPTLSTTTSTLTSVSSGGTYSEDREDPRYMKGAKSDSEASGNTKKFAWFKGMQINPAAWAGASFTNAPVPPEKPKVLLRHNFQQQSVLRFARCDHCGDKMWGTQLRCSNCSTACHTRCIAHLNTPCREVTSQDERDVVEIAPLPPSMFGRDLTEQVEADAQGSNRAVPMIVEKCIMAVEARGMDYEGIYRKTGGAGQSKAITHAFERGDYDAFDLQDPDAFNDICSVTSVLKNYFRALPNPLLTFELHEAFVQAASYRDPAAKSNALNNVLEQMPHEHFQTLRMLMLHLHGVMERSNINLMSARNLGVVFGPTLMRSADSAKEFADMAGKALCIEWLVENAPTWTQLQLS